eukprot:TRINITY_DN3986_c0_g1_i1.p1 TRINITY_DN3986_c0_g1~~TRINITY_DN3986_c0_g1_i1.p1  ORF type:complete len:387 (-),score=72.28 TRINITY_DN3986_c0_g1_i1:7-1167(-)
MSAHDGMNTTNESNMSLESQTAAENMDGSSADASEDEISCKEDYDVAKCPICHKILEKSINLQELRKHMIAHRDHAFDRLALSDMKVIRRRSMVNQARIRTVVENIEGMLNQTTKAIMNRRSIMTVRGSGYRLLGQRGKQTSENSCSASIDIDPTEFVLPQNTRNDQQSQNEPGNSSDRPAFQSQSIRGSHSVFVDFEEQENMSLLNSLRVNALEKCIEIAPVSVSDDDMNVRQASIVGPRKRFCKCAYCTKIIKKMPRPQNRRQQSNASTAATDFNIHQNPTIREDSFLGTITVLPGTPPPSPPPPPEAHHPSPLVPSSPLQNDLAAPVLDTSGRNPALVYQHVQYLQTARMSINTQLEDCSCPQNQALWMNIQIKTRQSSSSGP